jgi:hypothetical protein
MFVLRLNTQFDVMGHIWYFFSFPAPDGYLEMTAGEDVYSSGGSGLSIRPDKVYSYLSEEPQEDFPKRAYSVGSKPELKLKPRPYLESIVLDKTDQKSSSAPHLNTDKTHGHQKSQSPVGSQSPASQKSLSRRASREDTELFMEMSFDRPRTSSESHGSAYTRVRTSSLGQNFRPHSSSHGQGQRLRRTPDSKHTPQELKKDSRSNSQEMGPHELHSKHYSSSESVKKGSQESLKKISHERPGSIEKSKRAPKDDAENEYMMSAPLTQKPVTVTPLITGVATVASGEDYLAMSPGSYSGGYGQRHSPTSLRRSPIMEGESVTFGVDDKHGRGQGSRGHHSLTPGKSASMKVRKEGGSSQKMRRGYSADSSENYMVLGFGEKSKSLRDDNNTDDSYLLTTPGKDISIVPVVTAAMLDKVVSPYAPSHMRNKSPMSVGSHSSVDSSDDYCTMETDSSSRLSDTGSTSSGTFDPFQLIRKPELDQSQRGHEKEKCISRRLDYDCVKIPSDHHGAKTSELGTQKIPSETMNMKTPGSSPSKPLLLDSAKSDSKNVEKVDRKLSDRSEKTGVYKTADPFGLHKPEPLKPDISNLPKPPPLDIANYPVPSIPCPRSPLDVIPSAIPEDTRSGTVEDFKLQTQSSLTEGETSKMAETSPSAFIPGQRRSVSDFSSADKPTSAPFNRSTSNQSTASEEHKLNYAALDLDSSEDLRTSSGATSKSDPDIKPLQYAQIDFVKSEGLKSSSSSSRTEGTKAPFDFLE